MDVPATEWRDNVLFCFFVPIGAPTDWLMYTHIGSSYCFLNQVLLFSLLNQMLISSKNTPKIIPRSNLLPAQWVSLRLVELTHKINHPRLCEQRGRITRKGTMRKPLQQFRDVVTD